MAYTDEQLLKEYNDRLYKRYKGTDIGYGTDSGKDAETTLAYLDSQSEQDSNWQKIGKSFYNGLVAYTGKGIINSLQMIRDYNIALHQEQDPNYKPNEEAVKILDNLAQNSIFQPYAVQADTKAGQLGLDLVSGAGQLLGQIGTSVAFGGVGGALAKAGAVTAGKLAAKTGTSLVLGAQIAGNQYSDLRKQGVDVKRAAKASVANAAIQSQLERISLEKILKVMPASMKAKSRQMLENAATEGLTEFFQQYPEAFAEIYAKSEGKTVREMAAEADKQFGEITKEAAYNAFLGFVLGGGASRINIAINGIDEAVQKEVHNAKIDDMKQRLDKQEKSGINADYIRGVVNTNMPEEKVSIDGEVLWGYAQSKNPDEIAKSLGVTTQEIQQAAEDGLDIEVRQGDFEATALLNKDFMPQLENDISFGDGYTVNRGRLKKEYIREMEKAADEEAEIKAWQDEKISEMRKAGMNKQEALSAITLLTSAARTARPDNPMEFFKEYPLRFERMVRTPKGSYPQYSQRELNDKQKQLNIILKNNPMQDDYHVGIREVSDIRSSDEVFSEKNFEELNPDFTSDMAREALESGYITVYSSKPVDLGGFVSSSKMMAQDYAGSSKVYSKTVPISDIAWIDESEGQYAPPNEYDNTYKQGERGQIGWDAEGKAVIGLFENADASTFIHEAMGHYLSNILAKEAAKPYANPQIIKDFETLLKYAGTTRERWEYLTGKRRYGANLKLSQTAYHGTPHSFDKFDLGAIGTGEGNQAHGYGLYFAKDKNVAQAYKDVLGADKTIIQTTNTSYLQNEDGDWVDSNTNNVIEYGSALSYALEALDVGKTKEKAIKDLEAEIEKRKGNNAQVAKNFISVAKDAVDILNNDQFNVVNNSRILEVDIPDDKFLLDEQKNYFEQSEEVKSALAKAGFAPIYHETREWVRNEYGENAVKELDRIFKPLANGVAGLNSVNKKILLDKYGIDEETSQYISSELTQYRDGIYSATGEHLSINSGRGIYQYFTDLYASDRTASLHLNKNGIKGITYEGAVDGRCFVVFDDKAINIINTYNQAANGQQEAEQFVDDTNVPSDMLTKAEDAELVRIQEAWATAAEQYFLEGKAPSKELQGAFRRFKKWLTDIYQTVNNFLQNNEYAIPISDEVRQVFDRMLASEAEIRTMERVNGYFAKLPAVIIENMSETTKRRIQAFTEKAHDKAIELLTKKSLENFTAERKERIAEYRADILPNAEKEVKARPLYSASTEIEDSITQYKTAKTIAKKYLNDDGRVYANWAEELQAVQADINDRLESIIIMLQQGMKQSKNTDKDSSNIWYKVWYKEHKRMPSDNDIRQLAYEIYMGQRADVLPEYDRYGTDAKEELQELFAREKDILQYKDQVNKYKHKGLREADRMAFEMIAEKYGYGSGDDLANTIVESPTVQQAITARADELVQQAFPDIYKERALAEEATKEALYNDDSGLVMGLELQLVEDYAATGLAKQRDMETNQKIAAARWQQAVVGAKRELGEMPVADAIRTSRYITAERKAAVQAARAIAQKDYGQALRYKNQQALLHAMVQQSLQMRTEVIKWRKYINRQLTTKKETWVNDVHFDQAANLLMRMGYKRKDYNPFHREQSLSQYIEKMKKEFPQSVDFAEWLLDEHVMLNNPMQMTYEQFQDIVDGLKNIKAIAKTEEGKNIMGTQSNYLEFTSTIMEKLDRLETRWTPKTGETQKATMIEKMRAAMRNLDNFFEMMDNWTNGYFTQTFGGILKKCNDREAEKMMIFRQKHAEAYKAWLPDKQARLDADKKIKYDELGGASVDKHVLVRMLMNLGNEGNARVLCTTPPVGMEHSQLWVYPEGNMTRYDAIQQTKENLLTFLGQHLNERDIAYAQDVINIAGMNWDEMAAMEKRTKGFAPTKVEALPVQMTLADGKEIIFKGGYFPLIRDTQTGNKPQGKEIIDVTDGDSDQGRNIRTLFTGNGNLKERVNAEYQIEMRRGAEFNAIINGIHDLCWREAMSDFRRLFNDENMFYAMKTKLGLANMRAFREMLEKAANPLGVGSETLAESTLGSAANWLRRKTVNFAIMGNLKTAVQNIGNLWLYGNAIEGFGYRDVMTAIVHAHQNYDKAGDYKSLTEFVNAKSVFMREHTEIPDITLRDMQGLNDLNKTERFTMKWGAKFLAATDNLTARPVWAEAYRKKINEGASDREAVDFADAVIRRTLGSSRITDVSSMQRGGPLFKLFTMFQGFFNTQYNQWERTFAISKRLYQEGKYGEMMLNITSFVAAKWFFTCLTNLLLAGDNPFDDEDDENKLAQELIHYPISMLGPVGTFMNAMLDNLLDFKNYGYRVTAADSALQTFFRTAGSLKKAVKDDNADLADILEPATTAASYYFGVPGQMHKLFWNAYDVLYGDMEPELQDLYRRRPKNERM